MASDGDLLSQFSPVLQYDSRELYFADSAATFTTNAFAGGPLTPYANTLRRRDGTVIARAGRDLTLDFLGPDHYADGQVVQEDDYLDAAGGQYVADARRLHEDAALANRIYGIVRPAVGGRRWLQYWFFLYYNDKALAGFGLHEGDWEGIQVRVGADGTADEVTFAQHDGGQRAAWADVEIDEGTGAPVVYVALGSHASYLSAGSHKAPLVDDVCDGKGSRLRPALDVLTDGGPGWVHWPGRWGSSRKRGPVSFPSPAAPSTQRRWRDPDGFHEDARASKATRGPGEAIAHPPPVVTASRAGEAVTVTIHGTAVAKLVVSATVGGVPAALQYDLSQVPEGPAQPLHPGQPPHADEP